MTHVLIAGLSTRAAADSAVRAGFAVTTIDAYADLDLHPAVRALSLPRDSGAVFSAPAAARAVANLSCEAVVYGSNFENHPDAVDALASSRILWGNPSSVLRRVRDPLQLARAFRRRGIRTPTVRTSGPHGEKSPGDWLVKRRRSGGGHGVHPWRGTAIPSGCYLQERIEGVPGSVVFAAAGGRAVSLSISRQIIGDVAFGADGYRYCGNILAALGDGQFDQDEVLAGAASVVASAVAEDFGLVGLNGIDFVAAAGVIYPIEVNPRWCASMELVERVYGLSMFGIHAAACAARTLPEFDVAQTRRLGRTAGKAVVFARSDVRVGDTEPWLDDPSVRDVPRPGERIAAGHPVCTVLADGRDSAACYRALVERAARIYAALE